MQKSLQGQKREKGKRGGEKSKEEAVCEVEWHFGFEERTIIRSRFHLSFCHAWERRGIPLNSDSCLATEPPSVEDQSHSGFSTDALPLSLFVSNEASPAD